MKLRDILGKAYLLPEDLLRRAGPLTSESSPVAGGTPQAVTTDIVTTDRVSALKDLISIAQAEKVCLNSGRPDS